MLCRRYTLKQMVLKHFSLALLLTVTTLATTSPLSSVSRVDPGPKPIADVPSSYVLETGQGVSVVVGMDQVVSSNTTVGLVSSQPGVLPVPSSMTIYSGHSSGSFPTEPDGLKGLRKGTVIRITASTSDGSAYADITVN